MTARTYLGVVITGPNNPWAIRRGLDGADFALLDELDAAADQVTGLSSHSVRAPALAVILVGLDHVYAPPVMRLRHLGVPTWVIKPGPRISSHLYRAATAVIDLGDLHPAGR